MGSPRIKGNKMPLLTLGSPGAQYAADLTSWKITNGDSDSDTVTFEDAANGGAVDYKLDVTAIQSTASESFWSYLHESAGMTDIPFTIAPHGNAAPTKDEPHITGTLSIPAAKPEIGSEASTSKTAASTFEASFPIDGEPVLDRGAGAGS